MMDALRALDWGAYFHFRFLSSHAPWADQLMQIIDMLGSYVVVSLCVLVAFGFWIRADRLKSAVLLLLFFAIAVGLTEGLRILVARPRPEDAQNLLSGENLLGSFPAKGILLFSFSILQVAASACKGFVSKLGWTGVCAVSIGLVAFSEMFLGLNFLSDVIAGMAVGVCLSLLAIDVGKPALAATVS